MFLIDIPFRGCQDRSNRSSIVHAVSYFACGFNDTACTVHAIVNDTACIRACGVNDTACIFIFFHTIAVLHMIFTFRNLKNSNIFANSNLFSKRLYPLNQGPRTDVLMKIKPRVENLVTLSL
jgi:hypothetical protein